MVASAGQDTTSNTNGNDERTDDIDNEDTRPNDIAGSREPQAAYVNRKLPKCCGVYVEGSIYGIPVWYTVDTGASHTILSKRVFSKIQKVKVLCLDTQRKVQWSRRVVVVHHDKLKPYEGKVRPRWVQVAVKEYLNKRQ